MGYLLGGIALLVAAGLALWAAAWLVMWFVLPVLFIALPVAALIGMAIAFVRFWAAIAAKGAVVPRLITPDDVVAGTAKLPTPRADDPFARDRAWAAYPFAQARVDLRTAFVAVFDLLRKGWVRIVEYPDLKDMVWLWLPVVLLVFPVWIAVNVGAVVTSAVLCLVLGLVLLVALVGWGAAAGLIRVLDILVRRMRRARGSCIRCYHVTWLPVFPCDGCGQPHRDLRPGRLGGLWRRCGCGKVLPTTVLRAARLLTPQCPRCDQPLRAGGAVITDIRLPVFGPVSAGKTRLVYAGLLALRDVLASSGTTLDFVDDESSAVFDNATRVITSGQDTAKTVAAELPHALTARLTKGRRRALLHLFDAAGEFYGDREDNSDLEFLDHAQGLVFVVDPFSVPWVRDQLGVGGAASVMRANPATASPEAVYQVTARRLRDYGVDTRRRSLALTVVKADLLAGLSPGDGLRRGEVREWLVDAGLDNLVLSAERDFGEVGYFVVASVSVKTAGDSMAPSGPFEWLISSAGADDLVPARRPQEEPV